MQISPTSLIGNSRSLSSSTVACVDGIGTPIVPVHSPMSSGLAITPGEVSVRPYDSTIGTPVARFQRSATTRCTAMPPALASFRWRVSTSAKSGASSSARYSVLTPMMAVNGCFFRSRMKAGMSRGLVTSTACAPILRNTRLEVSAYT